MQKKDKNQISGHHLFIIIFKSRNLRISRDKIIQKLYKKKVISQVHYPPINSHPFYKQKIKGTFPEANSYFENCLSLPIYPDLKIKEVKFVCECLKDILKKNIKREKNR